jgi:hypothetical protein
MRSYQAILAKTPLGYFLTKYFLPSSRSKIPIANVNGKKIYSTGTPYSSVHYSIVPETTHSGQESILEEGDITEKEEESQTREHCWWNPPVSGS